MRARTIINAIDNVIGLVNMIESKERTQSNWQEIARAEKAKNDAIQHLEHAQRALEACEEHYYNVFLINEMILMMDDKTCEDIFQLALTYKEYAEPRPYAFSYWWRSNFIAILESSIYHAGINWLNSYIDAKKQKQQQELEDLLRLHS